MDFSLLPCAADGKQRGFTVSSLAATDGDINQVNVNEPGGLAQPQLPRRCANPGVGGQQAPKLDSAGVTTFGSDDANNPLARNSSVALLDQNLTDRNQTGHGCGNNCLMSEPPRRLPALARSRSSAANQAELLRCGERLRSQSPAWCQLVGGGKSPPPEGQQFTFNVQLQGRLRARRKFYRSGPWRTGEGRRPGALRGCGRVGAGGRDRTTANAPRHSRAMLAASTGRPVGRRRNALRDRWALASWFGAQLQPAHIPDGATRRRLQTGAQDQDR